MNGMTLKENMIFITKEICIINLIYKIIAAKYEYE